MTRLLTSVAALAVMGCGSTTYQRTVRAQADSPAPAQAALPTRAQCPSPAAPGSPAYLECERLLKEDQQRQEELGIGGSGTATDIPAQSSCADPISANDPKMKEICGLGQMK